MCYVSHLLSRNASFFSGRKQEGKLTNQEAKFVEHLTFVSDSLMT
jgi:hypothetical protein